MQGHTQSSESIWTAFNNQTTAYARHLRWQLKVSWKRVLNSGNFAVVGSSLVNSMDIISGLDSVVTGTDQYIYFDETNRLVRFEYDRQLQEPLGGIATAIGNFLLENTDGRFTPNNNATIGTAILPNRPIQMFFGFLVGTLEKTIPIFKGLTRQPKDSKPDATLKIECFDFMKFLNDFPLESEIFVDQRSDEIIQSILNDVGFGATQYDLETGLNTIGFAWFQKGQTAGDRIKQIAEAEEGMFLQDEAGVLRFYNRRHFRTSPNNGPVWDIDPDDVIRWEDDESTKIINRVIVTANPREVAGEQEIWRDGAEEQLGAGEVKEIWAQFDDPISTLTTPVATDDYLANSGTGLSGIDLTSSLDVDTDSFTTTVKITLTNNSAQTMFIPLLRLRGTPALVTAPIQQIFEDSVSIDKYQEQQLEIKNDFIDTESFAAYLAQAIVRKYKAPRRRMKITLQGVPQLQLSDWVRLYDPKLQEYIDCRVMRIQGILDGGMFSQILTLREIDSREADADAIVGITAVGSDDEFVGI